MKREYFHSLVAAACICCLPAIGSAESAFAKQTDAKVFRVAGLVEDVGASERINYSGKLRMLTQRIAASACYAHADVSKDASSAMLGAATAEFDQIIAALELGDESLGIVGAEKDRAALKDIKEAHVHWDPLHTDIEHIIENGGSDQEVQHLALELEETLEVAKHLVSVLVSEYADPTALLQSNAITIDIAGRQRMLAQRVSKNVCLLATGIRVEGSDKQLEGAVKTYDVSLKALRNGLKNAGVIAPPTDEIATGLDEIIGIWEGIQPVLKTVMAGDTVSSEQKVQVFETMNILTGKMNVLVGKYTEASKLNI